MNKTVVCTLTGIFLTQSWLGAASAKKPEAVTEPCMKCEETNTKATREFNPAFAHIVYFWLKNPDSAADRAAFETSLKKFMQNSTYAKTCVIGTPPKAVRGVVDGSFTYSLITSFESAENQAKYQAEEAHTLFVKECEALWEKVVVYDSIGIAE